MLAESLELSTRRAREQADDLAGVRTGRALGPGALAWHLLIVDPEGAPPAQLCGRPGWHTPHMFDALRLKAPTRPTTDNDALLQSATDSRNYGKLVRAESASAEAQLRRAAAALEPAEAGQAVPMVLKLVSLAEARGTRLPTRDTDERQQALLEALGRLGLGADEYVRKRFDLTKHEARAQVKGGRNGGQHSQQLVHVVWLLDDNTVLFSPTHRLEQLAGDKQPAIQSAEEQDDDGGLRLIVFGCGSTSMLVAPPKNWNGEQPKVQRASVEAGRTGGQHSQQHVQLVWRLRNGGSLLSTTMVRLANLQGDKDPAIAGTGEMQEDGRVRLTFACGSEPIDVTPPTGWGRQRPTVQRATVEAQHVNLHGSLAIAGSWYIPDAPAMLAMRAQLTLPAGSLDDAETRSRLAALTAAATSRVKGSAVSEPTDKGTRHAA